MMLGGGGEGEWWLFLSNSHDKMRINACRRLNLWLKIVCQTYAHVLHGGPSHRFNTLDSFRITTCHCLRVRF